jgi:hypothetical protein
MILAPAGAGRSIKIATGKRADERERTMVDAAVQSEILKELERLPLPEQHRVLKYVRSLRESPLKGVPGDRLLRFAGTITHEEAREFLQAIEDCRKIDDDEW